MSGIYTILSFQMFSISEPFIKLMGIVIAILKHSMLAET